jgi:hypothetical protein
VSLSICYPDHTFYNGIEGHLTVYQVNTRLLVFNHRVSAPFVSWEGINGKRYRFEFESIKENNF